jgi:hypothetical protein
MNILLRRAHRAVLAFAAWGWPLLLLDLACGAYRSEARWAGAVNTLAFLYVLSLPAWPITFLLDRPRRERAMARLCGLREHDERERAVTGEAARATLLLTLAVQSVLLVLSLVQVKVVYDPTLKAEKKGALSAGLGFSSVRHLDPFGAAPGEPDPAPRGVSAGGYLLAPSSFPVLAVLILLQLAAFRGFAGRRYEGSEA